jgi:hypothetical protein
MSHKQGNTGNPAKPDAHVASTISFENDANAIKQAGNSNPATTNRVNHAAIRDRNSE